MLAVLTSFLRAALPVTLFAVSACGDSRDPVAVARLDGLVEHLITDIELVEVYTGGFELAVRTVNAGCPHMVFVTFDTKVSGRTVELHAYYKWLGEGNCMSYPETHPLALVGLVPGDYRVVAPFGGGDGSPGIAVELQVRVP